MFSWSTPPGMMPSSFHFATRLAGAIFSTNGEGLLWSRLNSARIASATRLGSVSRGSTASPTTPARVSSLLQSLIS